MEPSGFWEAMDAAFAALGAVLVAAIGVLSAKYANQIKRTDRAELEVKWQSAALSFEDFLSEWSDVHADILRLFELTSIDRFLLLRAWNGFDDPKWTTAFFQLREGDQEPFSYVHFELDEDYIGRLRAIKSRGELHFRSDEIPQSAIKRVYDLEGVKASSWFFISHKKMPKSESSAITYCSFATHQAETLTQDEIMRCQLIVNKLQRMAHD